MPRSLLSANQVETRAVCESDAKPIGVSKRTASPLFAVTFTRRVVSTLVTLSRIHADHRHSLLRYHWLGIFSFFFSVVPAIDYSFMSFCPYMFIHFTVIYCSTRGGWASGETLNTG